MLVISANTIAHTLVVFLLAILKFIAPKGRARHAVTHWLALAGESWVSVNKAMFQCYQGMKWNIELPEGLDHQGRYLLLCNHRSWVDTMALQYAFNRRAPFMRFLMKHNLIYVPLLGFCWWALDMVFLKRYGKKQLRENPELRQKNFENAARASEKLRHIPVTMMVFPEGTRYSEDKHELQGSPYRHLLIPRHGGVGQLLYSFGNALQTVIDVTIHYPGFTPTFWQLISGQVKEVSIHARMLSIDSGLTGVNFQVNASAQEQLVEWLGGIWRDKDARLDAR